MQADVWILPKTIRRAVCDVRVWMLIKSINFLQSDFDHSLRTAPLRSSSYLRQSYAENFQRSMIEMNNKSIETNTCYGNCFAFNTFFQKSCSKIFYPVFYEKYKILMIDFAIFLSRKAREIALNNKMPLEFNPSSKWMKQ